MDTLCTVAVLRFDDATSESIRRAAHAIQRLRGSDTPEAYHPHISLLPSDRSDERRLLQQLHVLAADERPIETVFSHFGWFPSGVAFLGVTPSHRLLTFHGAVHRILAPSPATPWIDLYCPGAWVPHCTLATGLLPDNGMRAIKYLGSSLRLPLHGKCVSVEVIRMAGSSIIPVDSMPFQEC